MTSAQPLVRSSAEVAMVHADLRTQLENYLNRQHVRLTRQSMLRFLKNEPNLAASL